MYGHLILFEFPDNKQMLCIFENFVDFCQNANFKFSYKMYVDLYLFFKILIITS